MYVCAFLVYSSRCAGAFKALNSIVYIVFFSLKCIQEPVASAIAIVDSINSSYSVRKTKMQSLRVIYANNIIETFISYRMEKSCKKTNGEHPIYVSTVIRKFSE